MIEVEIKLPVYRRSFTEHMLLAEGFTAGELVKESDWYYNAPDRNFNDTDEALRIRTTESLSSLEIFSVLTYKGPKLDKVSMARREIETAIAEEEKVREILISLGYTELAPVTKLRQYYHRDNMTACVDQVSGLGSFLELEIIVEDESMREDALSQIEELLEHLDSSMKETTTLSYLCMLLRKQGVDIK